MLKTVLLSLDGPARAETALGPARDLGEVLGAKILLLDVGVIATHGHSGLARLVMGTLPSACCDG